MADKIKKGDEVQVMRGKASGKIGKVIRVLAGMDLIVVEGLNLKKKHTKPTAKSKQGGIIEKESPIHRSNMRLAKHGSPSRKAAAEQGKTKVAEK